MMRFRITIRLAFFIIMNLWLLELSAQKDETINLKYLFNDWAFSHNESFEDIHILRRSTDVKFLSMEERKDSYIFKKGINSILYDERINSKRLNLCGQDFYTDYDINDLWIYDSTHLTLTHILYNDLGAEEYFSIFTSIYRIMAINEDYINLG